MNNTVLGNIRKNKIKSFVTWLLIAILPNLVCFALVAQGNFREMWFPILLMGIIAWGADFCMVKSLIMAIYPEKSAIFKKYGGIEKVQEIIEEINNTREYEDDKLIIAKNYIASKRSFEDIIAYDDILAIHKLVHKTNFVIDWYALVITNKYNEQIEYRYGVKEQDKVDKLILIIGAKSKNAKLGYTSQARQHVKDNVVPIPEEELELKVEKLEEVTQSNIEKENIVIPKIEKYACPDCSNIISKEDKFCRNCGCKIDWS